MTYHNAHLKQTEVSDGILTYFCCSVTCTMAFFWTHAKKNTATLVCRTRKATVLRVHPITAHVIKNYTHTPGMLQYELDFG